MWQPLVISLYEVYPINNIRFMGPKVLHTGYGFRMILSLRRSSLPHYPTCFEERAQEGTCSYFRTPLILWIVGCREAPQFSFSCRITVPLLPPMPVWGRGVPLFDIRCASPTWRKIRLVAKTSDLINNQSKFGLIHRSVAWFHKNMICNDFGSKLVFDEFNKYLLNPLAPKLP